MKFSYVARETIEKSCILNTLQTTGEAYTSLLRNRFYRIHDMFLIESI